MYVTMIIACSMTSSLRTFGFGYETIYGSGGVIQAFQSRTAMNSLQSPQLMLLECIAQRWKKTNGLKQNKNRNTELTCLRIENVLILRSHMRNEMHL